MAPCLKAALLHPHWGNLIFGAVCVAAAVSLGFSVKRTLAQKMVVVLLLGCLASLLLGSLYLGCALPPPSAP